MEEAVGGLDLPFLKSSVGSTVALVGLGTRLLLTSRIDSLPHVFVPRAIASDV